MQIEFTCPQCGAEVDLEEDSYVFHCRYCDTTLKPTGRNEVQSFYFPSRGQPESVQKALSTALAQKGYTHTDVQPPRLIYAPYWRVKGMLFQWVFGKQYQPSIYSQSSNIDRFKRLRSVPYHRTFPAFKSDRFPVFSLGLRAQAVKMKPFNREKMGEGSLLVKQEIGLREAIKTSLAIAGTPLPGGKVKVEFKKEALIGESYSLLYFPFFQFTLDRGRGKEEIIVDGLSLKVLKGSIPVSKIVHDPQKEVIPYKPLNFIPFKCPNCGWDLPFQPHARIHLCSTCGRAWQEMGGRFYRVAYKVSAPKTKAPGNKLIFMPFWRLYLAIITPERRYQNRKEFFELFPQARIIREDLLATKPICFYIPAFRIRNPVMADKFASRMVLSQPEFDETRGEEILDAATLPAWLPLGEAMEMANILLFSITPKRAKRILGIMKNAELELLDKDLLWLPFYEKGLFLRQVHTDIAIQKNCIESGYN